MARKVWLTITGIQKGFDQEEPVTLVTEGSYIYKNDVVADIENDYQKTLEKCQKITEEDCKKYPWHKKLIGQILRLLAPLM